MKDNDTAKQLRLELRNKFEILQHSDDIEEQWALFEESITSCAAETIGKRSSTQKKCRVQAKTWKLIDKRKEPKYRRDRAKNGQQKEKYESEYKSPHQQVKRKCREDKKNILTEEKR